ncbi:hypothetical protein R70723_14540 [Paenibacillus sp. FSL R7-0273]|uniref:DUF975 family protein n=1 Tax=Paenibacillus sp. FSL R7-0273 TaxID=1536772 RepID=UPI0004F700FA|nr:DUF975 family protein [Paenibacillus sp. FSL R7-0273]AIQ46962.1 hypothetical protein R70723_14540 [Paenibacillus sp. FSL R7-0273]OMF97279.1 hypothetical protein BK144_01075 [Paenibacillus sp. FSL R7-0273]
MWERADLKRRAKNVLRTSYWKAFVVSLLLIVLGEGSGIPSASNNLRSSSSRVEWQNSSYSIDWGVLGPILFVALFIIIIIVVIGFAFGILLGSPLIVGSQRYFKRSAEGEVSMRNVGYAFHKDRYWAIVGAMLWRNFLLFLWFLLLIIPGIIKSYSYSQVPFILADNPHIGYSRAVDLSRQMTRGHKFRMFVLDLSFLGWILLGLLAFGIGILFVQPYINATKAELYLDLRHDAVAVGLTTEYELNLAETPYFK